MIQRALLRMRSELLSVSGTLSMEINPVVCGSSFKNKGVQPLLDDVCAYLPSPLDTPEIEGTDPEDDSVVLTVRWMRMSHFGALAFKIATDPIAALLL